MALGAFTGKFFNSSQRGKQRLSKLSCSVLSSWTSFQLNCFPIISVLTKYDVLLRDSVIVQAEPKKSPHLVAVLLPILAIAIVIVLTMVLAHRKGLIRLPKCSRERNIDDDELLLWPCSGLVKRSSNKIPSPSLVENQEVQFRSHAFKAQILKKVWSRSHFFY